MRKIGLILFLFTQLINAKAQLTIENRIEAYGQSKRHGTLFVHFDKNIYSNNETIYFTAYIIKLGKIPLKSHSFLATALVREVDSAIIAEDKFLMKDGIAFGSFKLTDSIATGNYKIISYTDKLLDKEPELVFTQQITIKSSNEPPFKANMKLLDGEDSKNYKVMIAASTTKGTFLNKLTKFSYQYGEKKSSGTLDGMGQHILEISKQTKPKDPNLYVKLVSGKDSTFVNLNIPQQKAEVSVKFYPEGGNLIHQLLANVAWEVKDAQNRPVAVKALLLKDNKIIDTIETSVHGIGTFKLVPQMNSKYQVSLIHSGISINNFDLPTILDDGITIAANSALVQDTLKLELRANHRQRLRLLIHNFQNCFYNTEIAVKARGMRLAIPLQELPKGLSCITILDSLNRPLAERNFFAHYGDDAIMNLSTDKEFYGNREKVELDLMLKTGENAFASIAVVQENRLAIKNTSDIESYTYLNSELAKLPLTYGQSYKNRNYLEQVLLVKGWRRYTWNDISKASTTGKDSAFDSLRISGKVAKVKTELKEPITIGTMGGLGFSLTETNANGEFSFNLSDLITPTEKKIYAFLNTKTKSLGTKIDLKDEFSLMNAKLSKKPSEEQLIPPSSLVNNAELVIKPDKKVLQLKEVEIKAKLDNDFRFTGANACGDYVCPYNILNCSNHVNFPQNTQPVKGQSYRSGGISTATIVYAGCVVPDHGIFTPINGIHLHKEFYVDDYKDPNEPAIASTLYWNYGVLLKANEKKVISFYTSDISGKFKVILQGITNNDVVYKEYHFEVKPKTAN